MKQIPCIKQYVLGQCLKTIITITNNITDMIFDDSFFTEVLEKDLFVSYRNTISFMISLDEVRLQLCHVNSCRYVMFGMLSRISPFSPTNIRQRYIVIMNTHLVRSNKTNAFFKPQETHYVRTTSLFKIQNPRVNFMGSIFDKKQLLCYITNNELSHQDGVLTAF